MIFDAAFTDYFWTKSQSITSNTGVTFPLPVDNLAIEGDLQDFLLTAQGQEFLQGSLATIASLKNWCLQNNINLIHTDHMEVEMDGVKTIVPVQNNRIDQLINGNFTSDKKQGNVRFYLYKEGVPLLATLVELLNNESIPLQKKIMVIEIMIEGFPKCPPRIYSDIQTATIELMGKPDVTIERIKAEAVEEVIVNKIIAEIKKYPGYYPGNEIHYVKGIMDSLASELGLPLSHDGFAIKLQPEEDWMVQGVRQELKSHLTVSYLVEKIMLKLADDLTQFRLEFNKYSLENDSENCYKAICAFQTKLDKYGIDEEWKSFYLAEEDDDDKYILAKNIEEQIKLSLLKRLSKSGYVEPKEVTININDTQKIQYVYNHGFNLAYVDEKGFMGKSSRKPLLIAILEEAKLGNITLLDALINHIHLLGDAEYQNYLSVMLRLFVYDLNALCDTGNFNYPTIVNQWSSSINACMYNSLKPSVELQIKTTIPRLSKDWQSQNDVTFARMLAACYPGLILQWFAGINRKHRMACIQKLGIEFIYSFIQNHSQTFNSVSFNTLLEILIRLSRPNRETIVNALTQDWQRFNREILKNDIESLVKLTDIIDDVEFILENVTSEFLQSLTPAQLIRFIEIFETDCVLEDFLKKKVTLNHLVNILIQVPGKIFPISGIFTNRMDLFNAIIASVHQQKILMEDVFSVNLLFEILKKIPRNMRTDFLGQIQIEKYNLSYIRLETIYEFLIHLPNEERMGFLKRFPINQDWHIFEATIKLLCLFSQEEKQMVLQTLNMDIAKIKEKEGINSFDTLTESLDQFNHNKLEILLLLDSDFTLVSHSSNEEKNSSSKKKNSSSKEKNAGFSALQYVIFKYLEERDVLTYLLSWDALKLNGIIEDLNNLQIIISKLSPQSASTFYQFLSQLELKDLERYYQKDKPEIYNAIIAFKEQQSSKEHQSSHQLGLFSNNNNNNNNNNKRKRDDDNDPTNGGEPPSKGSQASGTMFS